MEDEGELYQNELPAIELEIDDEFTIDDTTSSLGERRYGRSTSRRCWGRRCFVVLGLMVLGMAIVGGGLGVVKGRQSERSVDFVEAKTVSAEGEQASPSSAAASIGTDEDSTSTDSSTEGSTGSGSSLEDSTSDSAADLGEGGPDPTSPTAPPPFALATQAPVIAPSLAPVTSAPSAPPVTAIIARVEIIPAPPTSPPTTAPVARGVWISTGTPSVGRTASSRVVTFTLSPSKSPQAAPRVNFTPVPGTAVTSRIVPLSEALPAEEEIASSSTSSSSKTSWPELVGTDANDAVWTIVGERSELNVVLLTSGVDPPPSGFDRLRVVVYRTSDGTVDRMPVVG